MELLHIDHLKKQAFHQTSLGEQRLVLLARAMVKNPDLLILDESCQGLDKIQTGHFKKVVEAICDHYHKTLIYVSHYHEDIPNCVDHFLVLEKGRCKK